jgi:hypothetical protein
MSLPSRPSQLAGLLAMNVEAFHPTACSALCAAPQSSTASARLMREGSTTTWIGRELNPIRICRTSAMETLRPDPS